MRIQGSTDPEIGPPLFIGGLPHLVPGKFVDEYSKAYKGNGIIDLPNNDDARDHYKKVQALVKAVN
jgi:hypothetical protein